MSSERIILGTGSFGSVYSSYNKNRGIWVAEKCFENEADLKREVHVIQNLGTHPNILGLLEVDQKRLSFSMTLISKSLQEIILEQKPDGLCFDFIEHVTQKIYSVIVHLEHRFMVHSDIKPANVMVSTENCIYLIDWGLGGALDEVAPRTPTLCYNYLPLNIRNGKKTADKYTDYFSLGMLIILMSLRECYIPPKRFTPIVFNTEYWPLLLNYTKTQRERISIIVRCIVQGTEEATKTEILRFLNYTEFLNKVGV